MFTPREQRETRRIRRTVASARYDGTSAIGAAFARIGAAFDEAATVSSFKIRVERLIRLGPDHPAVRARFGARAAMLRGRNLQAATVMVERWWRDERKTFQIASALGCATRLSLDILGEIHLILRLMRFKQMHAEYRATLVSLCEAPISIAAE
jgi:hypothetical protein